MTVLADKKSLEVPLENMAFEFKKEPTLHQPRKWTLRVYNRKIKTFQIDSYQDGFSHETLENLVQQLKKIKEPLYDKT